MVVTSVEALRRSSARTRAIRVAGAERLFDVVVGAELERLNDVGIAVAGAQHDDRHTRVMADVRAHGEAVAARHVDVEQGQARNPRLATRSIRTAAVVCRDDGEAGASQCERDERTQIVVVIGDEHRHVRAKTTFAGIPQTYPGCRKA